ncbi:M23 family peptidase, partial [Staphylococcus cohnii]
MKNTFKTILLLVIVLVPLILLLTNIDTVQRYVRE